MTLQGMIWTWKWATSCHLLFLMVFHIIIHMTVPASQNSRRLAGNWREVAIYNHFVGMLMALLPAAAIFSCCSSLFWQLFLFLFFLAFARCVFEDVCFCVLRHVFNSPVKPSFHMWCRFGKCFLTACQYDWCWLDLVVMYVYLTRQMRSSLVRSGQSFKWGTLTPGCFECSQVYSCCVISAGICETSAKIPLWSFNQTCVYCARLRALTNSSMSIMLLVRERLCVCVQR